MHQPHILCYKGVTQSSTMTPLQNLRTLDALCSRAPARKRLVMDQIPTPILTNDRTLTGVSTSQSSISLKIKVIIIAISRVLFRRKQEITNVEN